MTTILYDSGLPAFLWNEALNYMEYVINRTPRAALNFKSPYEARFGKKPNLDLIRPWGSHAVLKIEHQKLQPKGEEVRYLGPDPDSNGIRVWWPKKRTVSVERNLMFLEAHQMEPAAEPVQLEDPDMDKREKRITNPSRRALGVEYDDAFTVDYGEDPVNYKWAMNEPDADQWTEAIETEVSKLEQRKTWVYAIPPKG